MFTFFLNLYGGHLGFSKWIFIKSPKKLNEVTQGTGLLVLLYLYVYWQNVLGTHHASAHGGSFGLVVKMLDYIFLK